MLNPWIQALDLNERLEGIKKRPSAKQYFDEIRAQKIWTKWKNSAGIHENSAVPDGLGTDDFFKALGVPVEKIFSENYLPSWAQKYLDIESIAAASSENMAIGTGNSEGAQKNSPPKSDDGQTSAEKFIPLKLTHCSGFLQFARIEILKFFSENSSWWSDFGINGKFLIEQLLPVLFQRLGIQSQRCIAVEINTWRLLGKLKGDSPEERHKNFSQSFYDKDTRIDFFKKYPVLARNLLRTTEFWLEMTKEFCTRITQDWIEIQKTFKIDPTDKVSALQGAKGDSHCQGRTVMCIQFKSGKKLVYKPRSLSLDVHFQNFLGNLENLGLGFSFRKLQVLDRDHYGWVEFVESAQSNNDAKLKLFYQKQGALLAILHATATTDMHFENLIANGEDPIVIDLETLFHGQVRASQCSSALDACSLKIRNSVLHVGMLPNPAVGKDNSVYDSSGIGGVGGQKTPYDVLHLENSGSDQPFFSQKPMVIQKIGSRPSEEAPVKAGEILFGFEKCYRFLIQNREFIIKNLSELFRSDLSRVVVRPTRRYGLILQDSTHPDFLRDGLSRQILFSSLWHESVNQPELKPFFHSEVSQLCQGDIPSFHGEIESRDLISGDKSRILSCLASSGLETVQKRFRNLSEEDLRQQRWFIQGSLGYLPEGYSKSTLQKKAEAQCTQMSSLCLAEEIGNEILSTLQVFQDTAHFLEVTSLSDPSVSSRSHFAIRPANIGLYEGVSGVCLFLAFLSKETGNLKFKKASEQLLQTIFLNENALSSKSISSFSGRGALVYLYSHLGALWNQKGLFERAENIISGIAVEDSHWDIISGAPGFVLSLLSLYKVKPTENVLSLAAQFGDLLLNEGPDKIPAWKKTPFVRGFSHGASGVSFAIGKLFELTEEPKFLYGALAAAEFEHVAISGKVWTDRHFKGDLHQVSWCHGAPGIALNRIFLSKLTKNPIIRSLSEYGNIDWIQDDLNNAIVETQKNFWCESQCICHGLLGNIEPMLLLSKFSDEGQNFLDNAETLQIKNWTIDTERKIKLEILSKGFKSGTVSQTLSNGLFTGLAGIGYGFLRLHNLTGIPSVLTLQEPLN